jgi:tetratricopeptide (TPR) repeat protein
MQSDSELRASGIEQHRAGNFEQARAIYQQLLQADPADVSVLNLLGALCLDAGQSDEASRFLAEALRLDPNSAPAFDNQRLLLARLGRHEEAVESFRRAAALDPKAAQTRRNLAKALLCGGRLTEAVETLRQVLQLSPDDVFIHQEMARLLVELGRRAESLPHFHEVARLVPADPRAHFNLAEMLVQTGQRAAAISAYEAVIRLEPAAVDVCLKLSSLHLEQGSLDPAVGWSQRALELCPGLGEAHLSLDFALAKQEHYAEAMLALKAAFGGKPQLVETSPLAAMLDECRKRLADSTDCQTLYELGTIYLAMGRLQSAVEVYDRVIALQGDHAEARRNRGVVRLQQGRFPEGLSDYEWRLRLPYYALPPLPGKPWAGEPLKGRTIILRSEGGLGDTLHYVRYAQLVKAQGAQVIVACQTPLGEILSRTPGIDKLVTAQSAPCRADYALSIVSLPERMKTTLESIPANVPYLYADPQRIDFWRQRLAVRDGFKIGIVWQGKTDATDWQRSIPLAEFAPLAKVAGVRFVSLQKGFGVEQLDSFAERWPIIDFAGEFDAGSDAFVDTAAIMKNLDLVITSDTAAAHLAGALGVKVWVALKRVPEWRWFLERDDSPWYPTMRLFRQSRWGDWTGGFDRMAGELKGLVAEHR